MPAASWPSRPHSDTRGQARGPAHRAPGSLYLIKQVELAIRMNLETVVAPHGVTVSQYTALSVLERSQPMWAADLARASFIRAQSAADLVGALLALDLVSRRPDPTNRRRLLIELTERGHRLLRDTAEDVARLEERMLAELSGSERGELRSLLRRCRLALIDDV